MKRRNTSLKSKTQSQEIKEMRQTATYFQAHSQLQKAVPAGQIICPKGLLLANPTLRLQGT